jgi:hypothetical protein
MTERSDGTEDDRTPPVDLGAEDDAAVRRLLADAGGPVPTPPDVVARLDATLSRLVAERDAEGTEQATVTPLAVRRRRWPKVLLAAAAVVVAGYGVGAALTGTTAGGDADSGSAAGGVADSQAEAGGSATSGGADSFAREPSKGTLDASGPVVRLSSADFDAEVSRLVARTPTANAPEDQTDDGSVTKSELRATRQARGRCTAPPSRERDTWHVVRYDGTPATLVVGAERDGLVRARVFSCDGTTLLRDSTVPIR